MPKFLQQAGLNKRGRGRQRNQMFRHNPCVLMRLPCHLYSICPRALFVFQHSRAPYCLHNRLRICSSGQCICSLELRICSYYNYIWDFRASCVSERATVFRNDSLRYSYSLKHRSCDMAYLLNKMMDPPDDPRDLCDPT